MKFLNYLFQPIPGSPFSYYIPLLILALALIVFGIMMKKYLRKNKEDRALRKLFSGTPGQAFWLAVVLLINLGARYERFPLVGARFVLFIVLGVTAYWIYKIYKNRKKYPNFREQFRETPVQKKYTTNKY